MACEYEVLANDTAPDGVAIAANKLTGGTIYATGSTTVNADLDHTAVAIDAGHKVDGIRPTLVTTGSDAPTTSTDGTKVILTFSEDISAADRTKITIQANNVTAATSAESAAGTKVELTLTTALTASATNLTVALSADAVEDAASNGILAVAATTVTNAVGSTTAPTVTAVALTSAPGSDNTYAIGEAVAATVTFDAAVDISGSPQLELDFDSTAKAAGCATDTNTTTMVCEYEVAVNDSAPNGIAIAANKLTGGTIYATGSTTAAVLTHSAVPIDAGHKVDGIRPTLVTTAPDAPTTSPDGETVLLVFSEAIGAVSHSDITIQADSVNVSTTMASVAGTKVELTLTTALTTTATNFTVALSADAVDDAAGNGILAVAATPVTNAVGTTTAPTVTGIALTSTPTSAGYGRTEDVEATVTFSAAVDITGNPQLELDFDGTAKAAACAAATNTTTMVCSYRVATGDSAPNGIAIEANKLTGGTITATGSTTAAVLDHAAVAIDAGHKVDGIRPTLVTTGDDAPRTSPDGTTVILTFSEDIRPVNRNLITIQANGATLSTTAADRTGNKAELTLATALTTAATNLTVSLAANSVFDTVGNGILAVAATPVTNAVGTTVSNSAPTFANQTETRSVAENSGGGTDVGNPVTATDTDSGDRLTYTLEGADAASFNVFTISGSAQIRTKSGVTYDYETTPRYTVIVKADDGNGGTATVTVTIDLDNVDEPPQAPAAPTVTATPNTTDSLTVNWSAPSNTGRPAIDSYDLRYREGTSGSWTDGPQGVSGTSATIEGLTADPATYQVQVRATNADGAGPWSPTGSIRTTPPPPVGPPSSPRNLTAMAGDQAVQLSWSRPVEDGGSRIVRYEYRQQEGDGPVGEWQIIGENRPTTDHRVTGLTNGVSYTFHVRAVNNGGWASPPSEPATATPNDVTPVPALPLLGQLLLALGLGAAVARVTRSRQARRRR